MALMNRRSFLRAGLGSIGTAALAARVSAQSQTAPRTRSVIWLWMDGGMSQSHTFDPKAIGKVKAMETAVPGIQVSELMKVCASQMARLSILRTVSHGMAEHGVASWAMHTAPHNGYQTDVPTIGTILAHELANPQNPLPPHMVLDAPTFPESPIFGDRVLPFRLQSVVNPIPNLRRNVGADQDRERADLLMEQNQEWSARRQQREVAKVDDGLLVADRVMNTPLLKAFNIHDEPEALRNDYGPGFGESCLMARRLIQAGCAFVEVGLQGWGTQLTLVMAPILDRALGTLVKDLADKNLLQDTLVVCATAFGRGPQFGQLPTARAFSVVLAGGFLAGGRVYGDTGPQANGCTPPVSIKDLFATIFRAIGVDEEKIYVREGRKIKYVVGGSPIEDLF